MLNVNNTTLSDNTCTPHDTLLALCDQQSEFNDYCAFFCKAAGLLLQYNETELNSACIQGAQRFAEALIERSQAVNDQLQQMLHST